MRAKEFLLEAEAKKSQDYDLRNNPWHVTDVDAVSETDFEVALQDYLGDLDDDNRRELYAVRPKMAQPTAQSTPPDATEQTGTWQLVDVTLNQPVETYQGTWAEADRIATQYETGMMPSEHEGHEISVRRA